MSNSDLAHHTLFPRRENTIKPSYIDIIQHTKLLVNTHKILRIFLRKINFKKGPLKFDKQLADAIMKMSFLRGCG